MDTRGSRACLVVAAIAATVLPMGLAVPATALSADPPSEVSAQEFSPIEDRYWNDPALRELLGDPVDSEQHENGISYQRFQRGWLYYSEAEGVHEIHGDIAAKFVSLGGHRALGIPTTDETGTPDGVGRFNYFTGTSEKGVVGIYWHPDIGAHGIWGQVLNFWAAAEYETGYLSYPTSTTGRTASDAGLANHFWSADRLGASVFWTPDTGAHSVRGEIRGKYAEQGWENGLGYPTTNEEAASDGEGRYNVFSGTEDPPAAIYWHPRTGAHYMRGTIYNHYTSQLGGESSYLEYPISDQYVQSETGDTRVDFEGGFIRIDSRTGEVIDGRW